MDGSRRDDAVGTASPRRSTSITGLLTAATGGASVRAGSCRGSIRGRHRLRRPAGSRPQPAVSPGSGGDVMTLFGLIVVAATAELLALVGILTALAWPRASGFRDLGLRSHRVQPGRARARHVSAGQPVTRRPFAA